ncbi:MAG: ThaI family type II restriction endonuclease [Desulfamplus sp.]|nr:ThaI family type II restriction endonuclease [Desulfamplus sp.]
MKINQLFDDKNMVVKIQAKLPKLFELAELESSRAGKIGMEVGSVREKIIIALLISKFGETSVQTEIPITEPEIDVILTNNPISIKTITGKSLSGVKLIWTVEAQKALEFQKHYIPGCDMILVHINWGNVGGFYFIPIDVQKELFKEIGRENYIKLPKAGTNPRGVEITGNALKSLIINPMTLTIPISWKKENINFMPYKRWIDLWNQN